MKSIQNGAQKEKDWICAIGVQEEEEECFKNIWIAKNLPNLVKIINPQQLEAQWTQAGQTPKSYTKKYHNQITKYNDKEIILKTHWRKKDILCSKK